MIRVLRVIEYEYDDLQRQLSDQARFTMNLDAPGFKMRSSIVSVTYIGEVNNDISKILPDQEKPT